MRAQKQRVIVLMGGPSSEYEISLRTGQKIIEALDQERYLVEPVIVTKERTWLLAPPEVEKRERRELGEHRLIRTNMSDSSGEMQGDGDSRHVMGALVPFEERHALQSMGVGEKPVVFIAMHGEFGEDGTVQGLLEAMGIPYTGSGVLASALAMDKPRASALFREAGLRVPDFFTITRDDFKNSEINFSERARALFDLPVVIKPADRGSSVGITIAHTLQEIEAGIAEALTHSNSAMIQRFIAGTELTCGVLNIDERAVPLQPTEIIPKERGFFDYHSKYTPGATDEITPPRLLPETIQEIQNVALQTHHVVGARGMSRTDMILGRDGILYVLEINTIPGMTETSLLPQAAAAIGIPFPRLLDHILASAFRDRG